MKLQLVPYALLLCMLSACDSAPHAPAASKGDPATAATAAAPGASDTVAPPAETPPVTDSAAPAATVLPDPSLPESACKPEGFREFFEAYVDSASVRNAYTWADVRIGRYAAPTQDARSVAKAGYRDFRIGAVDYRWVYLDPAIKEPGDYPRLDIDIKPKDKTAQVEYVKAEFDAEDNLVRTVGDRGAYVFELRDKCWYLTQDLR